MATDEYINKIICMDSKIALKQLDNFSVDLIVTSPPYFDARPEYAEYKAYYIYLREMEYIMKECYRVLKNGGVIAWNIGDNYHEGLDLSADASKSLRDVGFRFTEKIVWQKPTGVAHGRIGISMRKYRKYMPYWNTEFVVVCCKSKEPNYNELNEYDLNILENKYGSQIWYLQPETQSEHPAPFPPELVTPFILAYTKKGDIVADPFCGSGTTCVEAKKHGRRYIGFDYKQKYVDDANERVAKINEMLNKSVQISLE